MTKLFSRTALYLILIILLAGAVRTTRAFEEKRYSIDVFLYFKMANDWAHHGAEYAYWHSHRSIPPLLPWLMATGYNVGLTPEYTGLIFGILLGSLMPLAAFWIVLNLFSSARRQEEFSSEANVLPRNYAYGLLAAFLLAVHPFFVRISVSCLREILYLPFMAFAMAFAISAMSNKSLWKWFIFAVLATLANFARREGIFLILIFFVWQFVELVIERKSFRKNITYYVQVLFLVSIVFFCIIIFGLVYDITEYFKYLVSIWHQEYQNSGLNKADFITKGNIFWI